MDKGHCGLPAEDPTKLAEALLGVPASLIKTVPSRTGQQAPRRGNLELEAEEVVADALEGGVVTRGPLERLSRKPSRPLVGLAPIPR